jgi:hypothetical protein
MALKPGDSKDKGVVAKGRHKHWDSFPMSTNIEAGTGSMGDVTRRHRAAVDNLQDTFFTRGARGREC